MRTYSVIRTFITTDTHTYICTFVKVNHGIIPMDVVVVGSLVVRTPEGEGVVGGMDSSGRTGGEELVLVV